MREFLGNAVPRLSWRHSIRKSGGLKRFTRSQPSGSKKNRQYYEPSAEFEAARPRDVDGLTGLSDTSWTTASRTPKEQFVKTLSSTVVYWNWSGMSCRWVKLDLVGCSGH